LKKRLLKQKNIYDSSGKCFHSDEESRKKREKASADMTKTEFGPSGERTGTAWAWLTIWQTRECGRPDSGVKRTDVTGERASTKRLSQSVPG